MCSFCISKSFTLFPYCAVCLCSSTWTPQGTHLESNRDECTVSLVYAVHLMKQGSVSFDYQYVDNNIFFEFFVSLINALCGRCLEGFLKREVISIARCGCENWSQVHLKMGDGDRLRCTFLHLWKHYASGLRCSIT